MGACGARQARLDLDLLEVREPLDDMEPVEDLAHQLEGLVMDPRTVGSTTERTSTLSLSIQGLASRGDARASHRGALPGNDRGARHE